MSLRDPEFCEALEGFVAVSSLDHAKKLPKERVVDKLAHPRDIILPWK